MGVKLPPHINRYNFVSLKISWQNFGHTNQIPKSGKQNSFEMSRDTDDATDDVKGVIF